MSRTTTQLKYPRHELNNMFNVHPHTHTFTYKVLVFFLYFYKITWHLFLLFFSFNFVPLRLLIDCAFFTLSVLQKKQNKQKIMQKEKWTKKKKWRKFSLIFSWIEKRLLFTQATALFVSSWFLTIQQQTSSSSSNSNRRKK